MLPPSLRRCQDKLVRIYQLSPRTFDALCELADLVLVTLRLKRKVVDDVTPSDD